MIDKLRQRADEESGFTLIELLIVITILGILAAIVVFAVGTTGSSAKTNACKADVKTVETALEAYKAQSATGAYPSVPADFGLATPTYAAADYAALTGTPQYLKEAPPASEGISWDSNGNVTGHC